MQETTRFWTYSARLLHSGQSQRDLRGWIIQHSPVSPSSPDVIHRLDGDGDAEAGDTTSTA